jgi:hypothetical protein
MAACELWIVIMTPGQARLALAAFLLIASAVFANLLLLQEGRPLGASTRARTQLTAAPGGAHVVPPVPQRPLATGSTGKDARSARKAESPRR